MKEPKFVKFQSFKEWQAAVTKLGATTVEYVFKDVVSRATTGSKVHTIVGEYDKSSESGWVNDASDKLRVTKAKV